MILETNRMILRPWYKEDAESLYEYAKDPRVGLSAGWPPHKSVEESRDIIREILSAAETYAVTIKPNNRAVGSVGLLLGAMSHLGIKQDEGEIGYWIGVPFWGQGLIPEAVETLMCHAFENLEQKALWCGYFDGNEQSKRVSEKCGFRYHHTEYKEWPLLNEMKIHRVMCITKHEWLLRR